MSRARATIVLVTWNSRARVLELLRAIQGLTRGPYQLVVVDNASTDGLQEDLRALASQTRFRLVENEDNRRCAAATNQALTLIGTEYVVYLCASHAMVTEADWLERLVAWMDERPRVALAGDAWRPGFAIPSARYRPGWKPEDHPGELLHVQGGAWIARREVFEELGGLAEEEFPHGGTDVELSYRLLSHGKELGSCPLIRSPRAPGEPRYEPDVAVYHPASQDVRTRAMAQLGERRPEEEHPLSRGWERAGGLVTLTPGGARVRANGADSGLLSEGSYRDLRVRAKLRWRGVVQVKVRTGPEGPGADGYHVLLASGQGYLARAGHVLARFSGPRTCTDLSLEARGSRLRLDLDGRRVAEVEDPLLQHGRVLLGVNEGEAMFEEVTVEDLCGGVETAGGGDERPAVIVFSELLPNQSFCAAVVRELGSHYQVRPCGPGWPVERLEEVDLRGARFYLELDAASGNFVRPDGLSHLTCPKLAWLIDTHKKPDFHRAISKDMDLTLHAHPGWGHVLEGSCAWLPLHADQTLFFPQERERDLDLVFVGSQTWRADALQRIAERRGLRLLVTTTTGPEEKSRTAELYARSKIVFNRHIANDLNFRVFEAMACGRVLLTDAQPNGQYDLFEEDRHYVLYKDDADLERQVLRLLADDVLRGRIEEEAAALAVARHSTRARVGDLVQLVEQLMHGGSPVVSASTDRVVDVSPARLHGGSSPRQERSPLALPLSPGGRWLVIAAEEPPAVELASWAERLGGELVRQGQEVVVARERRGQFPPPSPRPGGPRLLEVDLTPAPRALTASNRMLTASVGLQRRLGELARREKLDGVLAEGPLGALVGPALAERLGLPLVYLLGDCEVHRRRDQLTKEQLYLSELEQWACERAARVLVPNAEVGQAACRHYGLRAPQVAAVPTHGVAPASDDEVARLLERLSLPSSPILVLAPELGDEERHSLLAADLGAPLVLVDRHTWASCPGGERRPRVLSRRPPRGPALGALLTAARSVLVADRTAEVLADVARLVRPGRVQFTDAWGSASVLLKLQPLVGSARVNSQ